LFFKECFNNYFRLCYFMKSNNKNLLFIDKPKGITSFDVIRRLRKKMGVRKMGYAGTLDPLASGLMIIGVGEGTKKLNRLIGLDKVYIAEILLGKKTDTGDLEGKIIEERLVPEISEDKVKKELAGMVGELELKAPLYSAIKRDGKPLYKYVREGKKVEAPIRKMKVRCADLKKLDLEDLNGPVATVEFEVGSGTYIRSLAEELGERLGTVATLKNLRRVSIGDFKIEHAEKLD